MATDPSDVDCAVVTLGGLCLADRVSGKSHHPGIWGSCSAARGRYLSMRLLNRAARLCRRASTWVSYTAQTRQSWHLYGASRHVPADEINCVEKLLSNNTIANLAAKPVSARSRNACLDDTGLSAQNRCDVHRSAAALFLRSILKPLAVAILASAVTSCSDDSDEGNPESATQESSVGGSTTATAGGVTQTSGGGTSSSTNTTTGGGSDYSHCGDLAPNSTCSQVAMCVVAGCGQVFSDLDDAGCMRPRCLRDSDCSEGELCFPAPVVSMHSPIAPRFALNCVAEGDRCSCTGGDVLDGAQPYCLPQETVFGDWGCSVDSSTQQDCTQFATWIEASEEMLSELLLDATVMTRAQNCIDRAREQFTSNCEK